jgi:hypothetical protein
MQSNALVVIGMHRSGTSALSGLLDELGIFMGKSLFAAQKGVNEKGFFENSELVKLNDLLLDAQLSSWDDPLMTTEAASTENLLKDHKDSAQKMLSTDYSSHALWGMKDPRTTLLLPFWRHVFASLPSVKVNFVLMLRSPFEVAGSLKKRDDFSLEKSLMLWLNYTFLGYFNSLDAPRLIVSYDNLLSSPETVAKGIAELVDLSVEIDQDKLGFVDKNLRNQTSQVVPDTYLSKLANELYISLSKESVDHQAIVALREKYEDYQQGLSAVLKEHSISIKKEEVFYRHLFLDAYHSFWWKCSWPIKKLEHLLKGKR